MCSCGGNRPRNPSGGSSTQPATPLVPCETCTVTQSPKPLVVCVCGSCYQTEAVTAAGSPGGGTYTWQSSNPAFATVTGSGSTANVTGVAPGVATITVTYNAAGCSCIDTVNITVVKITLELKNSGTIVASPENEDYATEMASAGGVDTLGPLPMGQGRQDFPDQAYTCPIMVIGTVTPAVAVSQTFRWKRLISRRSWNIRKNAAGTGWNVTQRTRRGFPDDDTGGNSFNDPTPSATRKIYMYDCSALVPGNQAADRVGDFIYEEKDFTYRVDIEVRGTWHTCAEKHYGQAIKVRRIATTGTTATDWAGVENSFAELTLSATINEAKVRGIVGGALPITIDPGANT
jgi:hypothetical protein